MKTKKERKQPSERWLRMTPEERSKEVSDYLARTKPEDLFPEGYRRFVANIDKMFAKPDQHQTPPALS